MRASPGCGRPSIASSARRCSARVTHDLSRRAAAASIVGVSRTALLRHPRQLLTAARASSRGLENADAAARKRTSTTSSSRHNVRKADGENKKTGSAMGWKRRSGTTLMAAALFSRVLDVFYVAILVRVLASWFPNPPALLDPLIRLSLQITEPIFQPVRQLLPPVRIGNGYVDLSAIAVILIVNFLRRNFAL